MHSDLELLECYLRKHSESAFAELVQRHASLVYAAALRQLNGDAASARDVTQIVFTNLALRAASLRQHRSLAGWLHTSARFAAAKVVRAEQRRQSREQEVSAMRPIQTESEPGVDWSNLRPIIDDALHQLAPDDREAILLRFFQGRDFKSVGAILGISSEAARKRVTRALDRLRHVLSEQGIASSESTLTAAFTGAAVLTIPADLHASIASSALATVALQSPFTIVSSLFQFTRMKTILLTGVLVAGLSTALIIQYPQQRAHHAELEALLRQVQELAPRNAAALAEPNGAVGDELARLRAEHSELLRLRDEVTRLRTAQRKVSAPQLAALQEDDPLLRQQQITIETKLLEGPAALLKKTSLASIGLDLSGAGVTAILTETQAKQVLQAFQETTGLDVLGAPRVTTLHNRAASIAMTQTNELNGLEVKVGPEIELLAKLSPDRLTVDLQATARMAEIVPINHNTGIELKYLRQTAVSGNGVLWDAQTLVISQFLGHGESDSGAPVQSPSCLLVLVTPALIDPAGNRLHPAADIVQPEARAATDDASETFVNRNVSPSTSAGQAGRFFRTSPQP